MSSLRFSPHRPPVSLVQSLPSLREDKLLQAVGGLTAHSLPAQQEVLRTLALLLTGDHSGISQAVRLHLAEAARSEHFREKVGSNPCGRGSEAASFPSPALNRLPFFSYIIIHFCLLMILTL